MPLFIPNTTCDIYRSGNSPPASPDVPGAEGSLTGIYAQGLERGEGDSDSLKFTHKMIVDMSTDIRDGYNLGTLSGTQDMVYVPDQNGTPFTVIYVEIVDVGMPWQHKRVFLARQSNTWPASADEL